MIKKKKENGYKIHIYVSLSFKDYVKSFHLGHGHHLNKYAQTAPKRVKLEDQREGPSACFACWQPGVSVSTAWSSEHCLAWISWGSGTETKQNETEENEIGA